MLKNEFEQKLREEYSKIQVIKENNVTYYYFGQMNKSALIEDQGKEGLKLTFRNKNLKQQQEVLHVYHWADAYQILYFALCEPKKLGTWDGNDVNSFLGRDKYDFKWNVRDDLERFDDSTIAYALELVKLGFVRSLTYDRENDRILIVGHINACTEYGSLGKARNGMIHILEEILAGNRSFKNDEQYTMRWTNGISLYLKCAKDNPLCLEDSCIFPLCGFLEYAIANGTLSEALLKREQTRKNYRIPCGPFSFTWKSSIGLQLIPENKFQIACQLVRNHLIYLDKELSSDNYICIYTADWITSSEYQYPNAIECSSCTMAYAAEIQKRKYEEKKEKYCRIHVASHPYVAAYETDAYGVYYAAAYIYYLQECGLQKQIDQDRAWFWRNQRTVEETMKVEFSFALPTDLFMDASDEMFEVAELLQEQNFVSINKATKKTEEGEQHCVDINSSIENYYKKINKLKLDIKEGKVTRDAVKFYTMPILGCSFQDWRMELQHVGLAAYIDYLRRTGQYEDYKERRHAYRKSTVAQFAEAKSDNPVLAKVLAIAENEKDSSLYCILQGERGVGKHEIVNQIAKVLSQKGKIDSANPTEITFDHLAAWTGYSGFNKGRGETQSDRFMIYDQLEKKKLYVLTNFREFFDKAQNGSFVHGSREAYFVELLGTYQPQTYVIILDEEKASDSFLQLSPQIQFLFGDNVITMPNLHPERLYEVFASKLSNELKEKLDSNKIFKEEFLDYIALNRKYMPLENQELAGYLADYANTEQRLTLPSDVYHKQPAMERLEAVIGMENIKKAAHEFEKYAFFLKRAQMNGMELPDSHMHMLFTGGPGTGKTMIARIMADMLFDMEIIAESKVIEVEPRDLVSQYIGESAIKTGQAIERAMGGVLFIDEAYAIGGNNASKEVIAALIKAMEDHKNDLVVIFAGYEKEMHAFLGTNPGLVSRIGYTFHFNDYTVDELVRMFDTKMRRAGFEYQNEDILPRVRTLCEHFQDKKDFGNGRFVDRIMRSVILAHSQRESLNENIRVLLPEDIPSIQDMASTDVTDTQDYERELDAFIGMENVKQKVRQFAKYVEFQQKADKIGAKLPAGNMHMIFAGNPGTGKTTIARIMADMLFSIGIIKTNKLIEVERKDLVAEYIGQTAGKTAEVIDRAMDGILFIDEAYTLTPTSDRDFGSEAIATLIKAMEDYKNNLIVIFAGYKDEMRKFTDANPGIASRIGYVFDFEDYDADELTEIYQMKMEKSGFSLKDDALKKAKNIFEYFSKKKNFGNGRFVDKLIQETIMGHSYRLTDSDASNDEDNTNTDLDTAELLMIYPEDIPDIVDLTDTVKKAVVADQLDSIIGMSSVKEKLREFESFVKFKIVAREEGLTIPDSNMHMIFTGNPGTGKTSIARIIASRLFAIGIISENKLVEVERKDLIAGYIGQTAIKVSDVVEKAMGGILFIDEAYSLTTKYERDFGPEAIATLIKAMEDHKDDLIVIFAGYKKEMKEFVDSNPGIASRIGYTFEFEDYSPEELTEIFVKKMESNGFVIQKDAENKLLDLMGNFVQIENFGNGRFVDRVIQKSLMRHAEQYDVNQVGVIVAEDIPSVEEMSET